VTAAVGVYKEGKGKRWQFTFETDCDEKLIQKYVGWFPLHPDADGRLVNMVLDAVKAVPVEHRYYAAMEQGAVLLDERNENSEELLRIAIEAIDSLPENQRYLAARALSKAAHQYHLTDIEHASNAKESEVAELVPGEQRVAAISPELAEIRRQQEVAWARQLEESRQQHTIAAQQQQAAEQHRMATEIGLSEFIQRLSPPEEKAEPPAAEGLENNSI
jgi:hypothetical protein